MQASADQAVRERQFERTDAAVSTSLAGAIEDALRTPPNRPRAAAPNGEPGRTPVAWPRTAADGSNQILDAVATALVHDSFAKSAAAVINELTTTLDCDRVSIGFVSRRLVRVAAISHGAEVEPNARQLREMAAAMDEAVDQRTSIRYPPLAGDRPRITLAHANLAQRQASGAVCTVPLVRAGEVIGAMTCERRIAQPFDDEKITLLEDTGAVIGPLLELMRERERSGISRLVADLGSALRKAAAPAHRRVKLVLLGVLLAIAAIPLLPVQYRVAAPARLEGSVQRTLVAPADGFLRQAHVRPGDLVVKGQVLAELADEDLKLEARRWESEVARHEGTFAESLARQDRAQVVIAQARAAEARAQLELVQQQLVRSQLLAPFDALVIKGDLRQQLGAPVKRGDTLLVLAPASEFRVIVEVEDREIGAVRLGQTGEIALAARPNQHYPIRVTRIMPVASSGEGRSYFEVEAAIGAHEQGLRPGLEGVAKIEIDRRPLYWVIGHRAFDWLRLALWSWTR